MVNFNKMAEFLYYGIDQVEFIAARFEMPFELLNIIFQTIIFACHVSERSRLTNHDLKVRLYPSCVATVL